MPFFAALFDLDGVLLDSVDALFHVYADAIDRFGLPKRPREEILVPCGMTDYQWVEVLAPGYPEQTIKLAANWCASEYASTYLEKFAKAAPGAVKALRYFQEKKIPRALVTNQTRKQAKTSQKLLGFSDFQAVVTMDDVVNPKPSGEPVLLALSRLGVSADDAFFLGDTNADLLAGKQAGVKTYLFDAPWNRHLCCRKLKNFDEVVNLFS